MSPVTLVFPVSNVSLVSPVSLVFPVSLVSPLAFKNYEVFCGLALVSHMARTVLWVSLLSCDNMRGFFLTLRRSKDVIFLELKKSKHKVMLFLFRK